VTESVALPPSWESGMQQRPRFKRPILSFDERLAQEARRVREQAKTMPPGIERENLLRKARQTETALHINEWLISPGRQPPK
jgi:hypothetical protein